MSLQVVGDSFGAVVFVGLRDRLLDRSGAELPRGWVVIGQITTLGSASIG